jgi:hypothetical protein
VARIVDGAAVALRVGAQVLAAQALQQTPEERSMSGQPGCPIGIGYRQEPVELWVAGWAAIARIHCLLPLIRWLIITVIGQDGRCRKAGKPGYRSVPLACQMVVPDASDRKVIEGQSRSPGGKTYRPPMPEGSPESRANDLCKQQVGSPRSTAPKYSNLPLQPLASAAANTLNNLGR